LVPESLPSRSACHRSVSTWPGDRSTASETLSSPYSVTQVLALPATAASDCQPPYVWYDACRISGRATVSFQIWEPRNAVAGPISAPVSLPTAV
jgi:hypothetical protein